MIEQLPKHIEKARKEVTNFLSKRLSLHEIASYHKCTSEWHQHKPNEYNSECLRLLNEYCAQRGFKVEDFY